MTPTPGLRADEREALLTDFEQALRDYYQGAGHWTRIAKAKEAIRAALSPKPAASEEREAQGVSLGAEGMGWATSKPDAMAQPAAPVAVPEGCRVADVGFRWDSERQQHIPTLLVEFEPVPANTGSNAKGWRDRDALAAWLSASPQQAPSEEREALVQRLRGIQEGQKFIHPLISQVAGEAADALSQPGAPGDEEALTPPAAAEPSDAVEELMAALRKIEGCEDFFEVQAIARAALAKFGGRQ
jgi:hypothetical protein